MIGAQQTGVSIAPSIRFALRDSSERWLHFVIVDRAGELVMIAPEHKPYRWLGTMAQLQNVYARYPETLNLQAVKISPSMAYSKER